MKEERYLGEKNLESEIEKLAPSVSLTVVYCSTVADSHQEERKKIGSLEGSREIGQEKSEKKE